MEKSLVAFRKSSHYSLGLIGADLHLIYLNKVFQEHLEIYGHQLSLAGERVQKVARLVKILRALPSVEESNFMQILTQERLESCQGLRPLSR